MNIELDSMIRFWYKGLEVVGKVINVCKDRITVKSPEIIYNLHPQVIERGEAKPVYNEPDAPKMKVVRKRADVSLTGFEALKKG